MSGAAERTGLGDEARRALGAVWRLFRFDASRLAALDDTRRGLALSVLPVLATLPLGVAFDLHEYRVLAQPPIAVPLDRLLLATLVFDLASHAVQLALLVGAMWLWGQRGRAARAVITVNWWQPLAALSFGIVLAWTRSLGGGEGPTALATQVGDALQFVVMLSILTYSFWVYWAASGLPVPVCHGLVLVGIVLAVIVGFRKEAFVLSGLERPGPLRTDAALLPVDPYPSPSGSAASGAPSGTSPGTPSRGYSTASR